MEQVHLIWALHDRPTLSDRILKRNLAKSGTFGSRASSTASPLMFLTKPSHEFRCLDNFGTTKHETISHRIQTATKNPLLAHSVCAPNLQASQFWQSDCTAESKAVVVWRWKLQPVHLPKSAEPEHPVKAEVPPQAPRVRVSN